MSAALTAADRARVERHVAEAVAALASLRVQLDPRYGGNGTPSELRDLQRLSSELFDARTALGVRA